MPGRRMSDRAANDDDDDTGKTLAAKDKKVQEMRVVSVNLIWFNLI
eukprot:COSAG04_NODE_34_length_34523_cov_40.302446_12_plen_46_part_00